MAGQSEQLAHLERLLQRIAGAIEANERSRALGLVSAALGRLTMVQVPAVATTTPCRGCGNQVAAWADDADYCIECAFGNAGGLGPAKLAHTLARLRAARDWHDRQNPHLDGLDQHEAYHAGKAAGYDDAIELLSGDESIPLYSETRVARDTGGPYCACETPLIDVEHDAGCRRCGFPVNFAPTEPIR